jgi:hypothetical protein
MPMSADTRMLSSGIDAWGASWFTVSGSGVCRVRARHVARRECAASRRRIRDRFAQSRMYSRQVRAFFRVPGGMMLPVRPGRIAH